VYINTNYTVTKPTVNQWCTETETTLVCLEIRAMIHFPTQSYDYTITYMISCYWNRPAETTTKKKKKRVQPIKLFKKTEYQQTKQI